MLDIIFNPVSHRIIIYMKDVPNINVNNLSYSQIFIFVLKLPINHVTALIKI